MYCNPDINMNRMEILVELERIIGDLLRSRGVDLVEIICRQEGRDLVLRILADRPEGGITLGECADLNRQISMVLDEKQILQENYLLEVSSPGLDRPLKTKSDFLRCLNRRAHFFLSEPISGRLELEGVIIRLEDESVHIEEKDIIAAVPLVKITKAKQIVSNT